MMDEIWRMRPAEPVEPRAAPGGEKHEVKLPVFWQDMDVKIGVYIKLPGGEEPVYLAMTLDADSVEMAQRFIKTVWEKT